MIKKKYLIYTCLVVSVFFNIYLISNKPKSITSNLSKGDVETILQELIKSSKSKISKNNCEIYRKKKIISNPVILDLFSDYLITLSSSRSYTFLECNDGSCSFHIGVKKHFESYSRILKFKYDKKNEYIDDNSFECIDIP